MKESCRNIHGLLGPYLDGELTENERRRVGEHLASCSQCRQELAELEALHAVARRAAHPAAANEHLDNLRLQVGRRLRREARPENARQRLPALALFRLATVGGALVVMLVVVIAGYRLLGDRSARPGPMAETGFEQRLAAPAAPVAGVPEKPAPVGRAGGTTKAAGTARAETRTEDVSGGGAGMTASEAARPDEGAAIAAKSETGAGAAAEELAAEQPAPAVEPSAAAAGHKATGPGRAADFLRAAKTALEHAAADRDAWPGFILWPRQETLLADTGTVELLLWVEPDSTISGAEVVRSSGSPTLDSFALRQALRARSAPDFRDGKPVRLIRRAEFRQSAAQPDNQ